MMSSACARSLATVRRRPSLPASEAPGLETAAAASYARRLVKEDDEGRDIAPVVDKMNQMIEDYRAKSEPAYGAKMGFVDEIVSLPELRGYMEAFAGANYQNPKSITPVHQMLLPRAIKG